MPEANLHDVYMALGRLGEAVEGLRRDMQISSQLNAETARKAEDQRTQLRRNVDELADKLDDLEQQVRETASDAAAGKAAAADIKAWKQRGVGALAMAGIAGTAFGSAIISNVDSIVKFFRGLGG